MDVYFFEFFGRGGGHLNMAVAKTGLFLQRGMVFTLIDFGKVYLNIYWNINLERRGHLNMPDAKTGFCLEHRIEIF